jgi:adenylate kinase
MNSCAPADDAIVGILLGAPGSGKGTQGKVLAQRLGIPVLSTGDLLRSEIASGTALGCRVSQIMARGELVRDEIVNEMAAHRISQPDCRLGVLLDGFPRSAVQARFLDELLHASGFPEPQVVHLYVPLDELKQRLGGRRLCSMCQRSFHVSALNGELCPFDGTRLTTRPDDRMETVEARLAAYTQYEKALVDYYSAGNYRRIDGTGPVDAVAERILRSVGRLILVAA